MAHPTRTGDLVVFAYPPYQFDAETPGTLVAPSHFFGQHGYVPDVQDLSANVNMRATFLAGGEGIGKGTVKARTIDLAPTLAFLLGIPEPQHSQGKVLLDVAKRGVRLQADLDHRAERLPRSARARRRMRSTGINAPVGGAAVPRHAVRRGAGAPARPGPDPGRRRQRRRVAAELACCWRTCRRSTSRTRGAWTRRPTATTSSTTASRGCCSTRRGRTSRSWRRTSSTTATGELPDWVTPSAVFNVNGVKVGVIGAELKDTPELVAAGNTAGLTFLRRGAAHQGRVRAAASGAA